ncbi:MAG: hypothetical protein ACKVUS_12685 [Saprospiraceae bacterium]
MVAQIGYDEIASLLAEMDPAKVLAMKASSTLDERVEDLIHKKREEGLTETESIELEHYLIVNRVVALAKIRARRNLHALLEQ